MEKKRENPPRNFCSVLPIMHGTESCSERSKYNLTLISMGGHSPPPPPPLEKNIRNHIMKIL